METVVEFPSERLGMLIGKQGKSLELLERMGGVKIRLRGSTVTVSGEDPLKVMKAAEVIKAIGAGFRLRQIAPLFNPDMQLAVYDVREACANEREADRQIARIIGEKGRNKRILEKKLGIDIAVSGHRVAAIGEPEMLQVFKEAIERLAHGAPHGTVYRHIEQRMASLLKY